MPLNRSIFALAATAAAAVAIPATANAAPVVQTGAGADAASITPARDAYRADLGGGNTAGANGSFGGQRREINWDGTPDNLSAPGNLPGNFFNSNTPRGAVLETPGSAVQVSGDDDNPADADPDQLRFDNLNATYSATFSTFSAQKLFTPVGSNITDVKFFVPGTQTPASVTGFGSVFSDVDAADTTTIQYYDENNHLVDTYSAPVGQLAFLGATYKDGTRISRVRIRTGNTAPGPNDGGPAADVVVMDDFLYGEPREIVRQQPPASNGGQQTPPVTPPVAEADTKAPLLSAAIRRTLKLSSLRKGVNAKATCDEACAVVFELIRGRTVLARKSLSLGTGTRKAKLKPRRRSLRRAPKSLKLRVQATDAAGNVNVDSERITIRKK
jgi:hypothetical protein